MSNEMNLSSYEDSVRLSKQTDGKQNRYSPYCDLIYYPSTRNPELTLAMLVFKPAEPSYIVATTHGWHMSIDQFREYDEPKSKYLRIAVDMRGRAFSDGCQDCNGWELYDVIDAIEYAKKMYADYIIDPDTVYFEAGSGGGGNAYAIAGKFPDYFAHVTAMCGMSDYALWYRNDKVGEFQDELVVWIGDIENEQAYRSRSGIALVENLTAPMCITHGETDIRVPVYHARNYIEAATKCGKGELISYMELPGVGAQGHWDGATRELLDKMEAFCEAGRQQKRTPTELPRQGELVVGGYLFTKHFSVIMNNIDRVARVKYDLDAKTFEVIGATAEEYELKVY